VITIWPLIPIWPRAACNTLVVITIWPRAVITIWPRAAWHTLVADHDLAPGGGL
jgi:hypothetical protein